MLDSYLNQIAQRTNKARREALVNILKTIGTEYEIAEASFRGTKAQNLRVPMHRNEIPYILIGAHYDTIGESVGANNNASGVAIALGILRVFQFIQAKKQRPLPLEFVFFDKHADNFLGSRAYAEAANPEKIYAMLSLNLCGHGDTVLLATGQHVGNSPIEKAMRRLENSPHQPSLRFVDLLPPSNEVPFEELGIPTASLCIVPEDDVVPMVGLAVSIHNGEKIALLPAVYECVHQPETDSLEAIQVDAMRQVMLIVNSFISNLLTTLPAEMDWK